MDGSAAAILGLLEAFHCPFIPHSCRATPVVLAVVSSLDAGCDGRFWGESPRPSATCLFGLFISVSTQPRVGFLLARLLAKDGGATSWLYKKSAKKYGGQITAGASQVEGSRTRTNSRSL